ncbi:MAG: hypothetical protein OEZ43_05355 [Gammaproteobacteria bacterium]|nr:hypothetical protein [Gammaproteobacteria bacterium]
MAARRFIFHHPIYFLLLVVFAIVSIAKAEVLISPSISKLVVSNPLSSFIIKPIAVPVPVNGTLILYNRSDKQSTLTEIRLPEAKVYLVNSSNVTVDSGLTQLDGRFDLTAPKQGDYQLCWEVKNLTQGCKSSISVGANTVYMQRVLVAPSTSNYVYGLSLLQEGRPCWLHEPFFGVNLSTSIELIDSANKIVSGASVKANVAGEFAIGLPSGDKYRLRSSCEKTRYSTRLTYSVGVSHADLPLNNHVPGAVAFAAFDLGGKGIVRADPGTLVNSSFSASDKDGDTLTYTWKVIDGSGKVPNLNSKSQDWTLPSDGGMRQIYVMASDGKGGYALDRLNLTVGPPIVLFSGIAIDEVTRQPVADAIVDVAGVKTMTDGQGWFDLKVPESPRDQRYSLNINHFNYATYSRVLDKSSRGNTYELIRAQVTQHDPELPIDVVDVSSSGPCGIGDVQIKNPDGKTATPDRKCERRAARLRLPAKSLVYADQSPAKGPISLSMATLNPARRTLPGDYRAIDANGDDMELVSFGALYATFRDVFGNPINLKHGMEALLDVPVSNDQLAEAKPTIPMWSYEEKTGLWLEEGEAKLQYTGTQYVYEGTTKHFSTINMDVAGNDPNVATCVRLELGSSLSSWSNLVLRAYVTEGGSTSSQVKETALDGDQYHAFYRIPYSNPPAGNTLRLELRGTLPSGNLVVLLDDIIQTDLRPKMTGVDLWPDYPYTECGDPIVLEADPVDLPYYGDIDSTGRPAFLTGPYGQYLPENPVQTAADYYAAIDPGNNKLTLGDWWTENGFGADGSGGTRASYMNHNDLGFGRDMHCLGNATDYACYVTNYGLPDQNPANANDAVSQNPATQGATVTMEYHSLLGNNAVSFYAYGGGVSASTRISFADLDGLGPKPLPHLCMICHGSDSSVLDGSNQVVGAKFREFDLPSFRYSNNRSWDYGIAPDASGVTTLSPAEFSAFHTLNSEVADINPGNKIEDLINKWFPGASTVPVQPAVPANWLAGGNVAFETQIYDEVYGTTCRTCHIARGFPETYNQLTGSEYTVCGHPKIMPNAVITYKNFWSDLPRVDLFETAVGNPNCEQ